jgi:RsiW-degrading membrane proteinase PrsW (M82 family)
MGSLLPLGEWVRNPALRSWPVLLFISLVAVPPIALVVFVDNPSQSTFDEAAWILAAYFALAWLLLVGMIVRSNRLTWLLLAAVTVIALVTQVPLAIALEDALHSSNSNLFASVFTIGLPEELAKAIPVLAIALVCRKRLAPTDYLFLGAVSGLVFGASEAQHYLASGVGVGTNPTMDLVTTLQYIWRFPTDPISHACWAGLTGYFIGLAFTGEYRWYRVGWIGLAMASVLHGLNDWSVINGHSAWVVVVVGSALLFLTYAKAGSADADASADPARDPAAPTRPSPAPSARATDPDRLLRDFKKTLGRDD